MKEVKEESKVFYGIDFLCREGDSLSVGWLKQEHLKCKLLRNINVTYSKNKKGLKKENLTVTVGKKGHKIIYQCLENKGQDLNKILKTKNFVPKFFVNNLDINLYKKKLSKLEKERDILQSKLFLEYNNIFIKNFNVLNGVSDVYEWLTGAIKFKDYEWEEIGHNSLKELFETQKNGAYIYSLQLDNAVMLRGSDIYYYFSSDISRFEKPNILQINRWFDNCCLFYKRCLKALARSQIKSCYDLRLILAVIDNLRNIILLLLNCELLVLGQSDTKNFISFLDNHTDKTKQVDKYISYVKTYQKLIRLVCFQRPMTGEIITELEELIKDLIESSKKTREEILEVEDPFILGKCFNPLREIDNYFENYIVCEYAIKKALERSDVKEINLIGVLYGGLELPFIIQNNSFTRAQINIGFVFQNHGMYLDRQQKDKRTMKDDFSVYGNYDREKTTIIIDDNIMSGLTVQFIYNQLYLIHRFNVEAIIAIRHPNTNRVPQLQYFDTAMNLDMIDKMIYGLVTDTPYTKIKENKNYNNMFVNELGIFSVMTEVFLKALYINNSFVTDSEVDIFKGFSEGRDA